MAIENSVQTAEVESPTAKAIPNSAKDILRFVNPLLDVLHEKGGQARPKEVYDVIADRLNLSEEDRTVTLKNGGLRFWNQIAWARSYLFQAGYLDSPAYGVWRLTDKGKQAVLSKPDIDHIFQTVQALAHSDKVATTSATADDDNESVAPSPQTSPYSNHRAALIQLIAGMSSIGFEEFCAELLTRSGVEDVHTTPPHKDQGIDGTGRLRINEFVSQPVAFQAKHYTGQPVSSDDIHKFRGAMGGHVAKGIFFTTTRFTPPAKIEAHAPGSVEIELVDLDRILEICEKYMIGLNQQVILVPDRAFFGIERFHKE